MTWPQIDLIWILHYKQILLKSDSIEIMIHLIADIKSDILSNALDTEIKNSIKTFSRESLNLLFILKEFQFKFINLLRNYLQSYFQKSNIEIDDKLFLKL